MRVQRDPGYYYIKVKIKSLAAEAKIIRREESKARTHGNRRLRMGLADHRRGIVRTEARHALLAYGFLRGRPYKSMEAKCHPGSAPDFKKVRTSIEKYGCERRWDEETQAEFKARQSLMLAEFDKWVKEAKS
jgi:hypothetical protein